VHPVIRRIRESTMSEPYAALAQVTIERAALIAYLAAQPPTASQWDD